MDNMDETHERAEELEQKKKSNLLPIITALLALAVVAGAILGFMLYSRYKDVSAQLAAKNIYGEEFFYYDSITVNTFKKMVSDGEDFVVFIGRPNCGDCRNMEEPVKEIVERLGIREDVYYLNVAMLHKNTEAWVEFKAAYGDLPGTPTYARYANGGIDSFVGWTEAEGISGERVEAWLLEQGDYFGIN